VELSLLVLRCSDILKSKTFYETLGFKFTAQKHGDGPDHFVSGNHGFALELYPKKPEKEIDCSMLAFAVKDPSVKAQLKEKLGWQSAVGNPGDKLYLFRDPDGRKIEIRLKA
jgi:lactoylglutathione lyase